MKKAKRKPEPKVKRLITILKVGCPVVLQWGEGPIYMTNAGRGRIRVYGYYPEDLNK